MFEPEIMRMFERILVVCGGILSIYLGYLLFHIAVLKQESAGKFKSALFEFTATKVGPGVFFALFGAYILYGSLNHPITTNVGPRIVTLNEITVPTRLAALETLTDLARKLPAEQDRAAAEGALKTLRTTFSGDRDFWGSTPTPTGPAAAMANR
jgi:hypothetical protein